MQRLRFLVWKELLELRLNPRLFGIVIMAPIIQLTMLGYAATTDVRDVPVVVADEPDESKPDDWLLHAYFDNAPTEGELARLKALGSGEPQVEQLAEADWVTMSQSGLQPIRAGRFFVHTPTYRAAPPGTISFEIDASLAFGTGQHATTSGCLEALDKLGTSGAAFSNVADIGR